LAASAADPGTGTGARAFTLRADLAAGTGGTDAFREDAAALPFDPPLGTGAFFSTEAGFPGAFFAEADFTDETFFFAGAAFADGAFFFAGTGGFRGLFTDGLALGRAAGLSGPLVLDLGFVADLVVGDLLAIACRCPSGLF